MRFFGLYITTTGVLGEEKFTLLWLEGQTMLVEQIIVYASK